MYPYLFETSIIANDVFVFPALPTGKPYLVTLSGLFDTATVVFGYASNTADGEVFTAYEDANGDPLTRTAPGGYELKLPHPGRFAFTVTGITGDADIYVTATPQY